jgi:hypothetical protein
VLAVPYTNRSVPNPLRHRYLHRQRPGNSGSSDDVDAAARRRSTTPYGLIKRSLSDQLTQAGRRVNPSDLALFLPTNIYFLFGKYLTEPPTTEQGPLDPPIDSLSADRCPFRRSIASPPIDSLAADPSIERHLPKEEEYRDWSDISV